MRLTLHEIESIVYTAKTVFGKSTSITLFGSRVDNSKRGGDIDLYIETVNTKDLFDKKLRYLLYLKRYLVNKK